MNAEELKIQNPELYTAIFAAGRAEGLTVGKTEGATAERNRIAAIEKLAGFGASELIAAAKADPAATAESVAVKILAKQSETAKNRMSAISADAIALGGQAANVGTGAPAGTSGSAEDAAAVELGKKMKKSRR